MFKLYYILYMYVFSLTWMFLAFVASSPLTGTMSTMTARPASTEGPSSNHRKTIARAICRGQDHNKWMKLVTSLKRWASADIRFTVSPTVDSLRVSLDTTKDWKGGEKREEGRKKWKSREKVEAGSLCGQNYFTVFLMTDVNMLFICLNM